MRPGRVGAIGALFLPGVFCWGQHRYGPGNLNTLRTASGCQSQVAYVMVRQWLPHGRLSSESSSAGGAPVTRVSRVVLVICMT